MGLIRRRWSSGGGSTVETSKQDERNGGGRYERWQREETMFRWKESGRKGYVRDCNTEAEGCGMWVVGEFMSV